VNAELVARGIRFPEGPVWCPDPGGGPGTLVCTSVADGALVRVHVDSGQVEPVAAVGGGANSAALARDGGFLVTQNGGIDFASTNLFPEDPPAFVPVTPGIQRVSPDGAVTYVSDRGFRAPNDLVVASDGTVWFTDPPPFPPPDEPVGRVHTMSPDGDTHVVARGFAYCNGIALEPDGTAIAVEAQGLVRLDADGGWDWIVEQLPGGAGDGFCVDVDGRLYVANTAAHGVRVVDPDGSEVDFLAIEGNGVTTNCCFGGADGRTLFATDGLPGQVVAWEGMPTAGLPLHPWAGP
jgi:gluconolactonase